MTQPPGTKLPETVFPARLSRHRPRRAHLLGLGTATPRYRWPQTEAETVLAEAWSLRGVDRLRWQRICRGSKIEHRHGVAPAEQIIDLTTAQRMELFEREAPPLAVDAAKQALDQAMLEPDQITDLIVVTCTGFAAPGLGVELVDRLGLSPNVRRMQVGFMGCFGAITGLRAAIGSCAADPAARVLVVCCELCTLHVRRDADVNNQVACALFGDGAAAAVIAPNHASSPHPDLPHRISHEVGALGRFTLGSSHLLDRGRDWMTWRITDRGFAMTLSRDVPQAVREALVRYLPGLFDRTSPPLLVHPGGPGILDAVAAATDRPDDRGLPISRAILREFGNISSGTILFVLERALKSDVRPPLTLLAFGPGLTIESMGLEPPVGGTR